MKYLGKIILLGVAVIWGLSIVFQSAGMRWIAPWTFNSIKFFLAALILTPLTWKKIELVQDWGHFIKASFVCGFFLSIAAGLQLVGLQHTFSGKVGFITTLYYVFVPILEAFSGKPVLKKIWVGVGFALVGFALLSGFPFGSYSHIDGILVVSALFFAFHILSINFFASKYDSIIFTQFQFLFALIISGVLVVLFEDFSFSVIREARFELFYSGIIGGGIGFTLQTLGQAKESPTTTSLLLSLEAVFSVIFGWLILHEVLSVPNLVGCFLILFGCFIANLDVRALLKKRGK